MQAMLIRVPHLKHEDLAKVSDDVSRLRRHFPAHVPAAMATRSDYLKNIRVQRSRPMVPRSTTSSQSAAKRAKQAEARDALHERGIVPALKSCYRCRFPDDQLKFIGHGCYMCSSCYDEKSDAED